MAIELNVGGKTNIGVQTAVDPTVVGSSAPGVSSSKILRGNSLTVLSGAMSDVEKLVARLRNETDNTRMSVTQQRIAVLQTVLDTIPDRVTEKERKSLIEIEGLNGEKAELEVELAGYKSEKVKTEGRIAELDLMIETLEKQIEQAVQDGEDHRKQVEKLKEQRSREQEQLDRIDTAISSANARISGIDVKIAELTKTIAQTTLNEVANALRIAASDGASRTSAGEVTRESNADSVKKARKEAETDIGNVIRESLDRIDGQMRETIDEVQMKVEG